MSKYINADELKGIIQGLMYRSEKSTITREALEGIIDNVICSADVVEVKHGEWQEVKRWECSTHSVTDMKCSVCHHYASQVLPHQTTCTYDFCPFCGADMRERKDSE